MKIMLPVDNSGIVNDSINSDYALFVDKLNIYRVSAQGAMMVGGVMQGGSFPKLYHQIYFTFWDNIKGRVVSYGWVDDDSTVIFAMTRREWESVVDGIADKILSNSPFLKTYSSAN